MIKTIISRFVILFSFSILVVGIKTGVTKKDATNTFARRSLQSLPTGWKDPPSSNWVPETSLGCSQSASTIPFTTKNPQEFGCAPSESNSDDFIESIMIDNPDTKNVSIFAGFADKSTSSCIKYSDSQYYTEGYNKFDYKTSSSLGLFNVPCRPKGYKLSVQKCCFIVQCLDGNGCGNNMKVWYRIYDEVFSRSNVEYLSVGARAGLGLFGIFCICMIVSIILHFTNVFRFYCFDYCNEKCCQEKRSNRRTVSSSSYSIPSYPVGMNIYTQQPTGIPKGAISSAGYGAQSASGRNLYASRGGSIGGSLPVDITKDRSKVAGASTLTGKMGSSVNKSVSTSSLSSTGTSSTSNKNSRPKYDDNFDDRPRRR
jgi:hypothetical protein